MKFGQKKSSFFLEKKRVTNCKRSVIGHTTAQAITENIRHIYSAEEREAARMTTVYFSKR